MIANSPEKSANSDATRVDGGAKVEELRGLHAIEARWRSGDAEDCKSLHPGSIPGRASIPGVFSDLAAAGQMRFAKFSRHCANSSAITRSFDQPSTAFSPAFPAPRRAGLQRSTSHEPCSAAA